MRKLEYTFKTDTLFKAETEEELEKIKEMEVPVMSQAINAYYTITASSEFREKERLRAKAKHNEAQALYNARKEIAQNMKEVYWSHKREYRKFECLIKNRL